MTHSQPSCLLLGSGCRLKIVFFFLVQNHVNGLHVLHKQIWMLVKPVGILLYFVNVHRVFTRPPIANIHLDLSDKRGESSC